MTPLPAAVLSAFPQPRDRVEDRPWWRFGEIGRFDTVEWVRTDGCRVSLAPRRKFFVYGEGNTPDIGGGPDLTQPVGDLLAEIDRRWPVPAPGFRAGQVWANRHGGAVVLLSSHPLMREAVVDESDRPLALSEFCRGVYPYLVADPACPHLAPWGP